MMLWIPLWTFIVTVSLYDSHLTAKYSESLPQCEKNPIARKILKDDQWNVSRFLILKVIGTLTVICLLYSLHTRSAHIGAIATISVAVFQLVLLIFYLGFDDIID